MNDSVSTFDNILSGDSFRDKLSAAFEKTDGILTRHSGPFASSAIIGSRWRQRNDIDEFTKDGIKILNNLIVSDDPVERLVARLCRNVGISVDNRCHDGTTTSMSLLCKLGILASENLKAFQTTKSHRYIFSKVLEKCFQNILDNLEDFKITPEEILERCISEGIETTLERIRGSIAFYMAMIASKGDVDLSTKIATVIEATPPHIYGIFTKVPTIIETEEKYILEKQDFDINQSSSIGNNTDFNYMNGTQYLAEDAVLFVTGDQLNTQSYAAGFLSSFISTNPTLRADLFTQFGMEQGWEDFHEGKRNLIIISSGMSDHTLMQEINVFNIANPKCKISWFNINLVGRMLTTFDKTVNYMSGAKVFMNTYNNAEKSLIGLHRKGITVKYIGSNLALYNLYDKDGGVFHPYYTDESASEDYTHYKKELEELIEFVRKNVTNPALDHDEFNYVCGMYRALTTQTIYTIKVGGRAHDQRSNVTVYEDAIGAAMSAMDEHIILSGYEKVVQILLRNRSDSALLETSIDERIINHYIFESIVALLEDSMDLRISSGLEAVLIDTSKCEQKWRDLHCERPNVSEDMFSISSNTTNNFCIKTFSKDVLKSFIDRDPTATILIQSYAGYDEQFKRFLDIIPRLALTDSLIDMRIQDGDAVR